MDWLKTMSVIVVNQPRLKITDKCKKTTVGNKIRTVGKTSKRNTEHGKENYT